MGSGFRRDVQGLRAVAVLLVVAYHAGLPVPGGFLGVDVFFVISGFLITGLLVDELRATGRVRFGAFVGRRVRRLLPALAVMTTATVAASHYLVELGRPLRAVADTGIAASLFVANLQLYRASDYFAPDAERNPLLHTWSLSVEEQFYLALPVALGLLWASLRRMEGRERWLFRGLAVAALASFGLAIALADLGVGVTGFQESGRLAFYLPFTRAWEFLAGSLLALHLRRSAAVERVRGSRGVESVHVLGGTLVLGSAFLLTGSAAVPGLVTLPVVGGTVVLIWAGSSGGRGTVQRVLDSRVMNWIGDRSYGWYLWHWPLLVLADAVRPDSRSLTVLAIVASIGLAAVSYRVIETPLRRTRPVSDRWMTIGVAIVSIVIPTVSSVVVAGSSDGYKPISSFDMADGDPCADPPQPWSDACRRFEVTGGDAPVLMVVGDSHCESLVPGAIAAAGTRSMDVVALCRSATPFVAAPPMTSSGEAFHLTLEAVGALEPAIVVVSNRSRRNLDPDAWERWTDRTFSGRDEAARSWGEAVGAAATDLKGVGVSVIWVSQVPEFPDAQANGSRTVPFKPVFIDPLGLDRQRADVLSSEALALEGVKGVISVDPATALCTPACANGAGTTPFYRDFHHLNPAGSRFLAPLLTDAIGRLLAG